MIQKNCIIKRISSVLFCVLLMFSLLFLASCSEEDMLSGIEAALSRDRESHTYEYVISCGFSEASDEKEFESRLDCFGLTIIKKDISKNGEIQYTLYSHDVYEESVLMKLSENYTVSIENSYGEKVIDKADVLYVKYDKINVQFYVAKEFYDSFNEKYYGKSIYVVNGSNRAQVFNSSERINDEYIVGLIGATESKNAVHECAIAFASEPLKGEIDINIVQNAKEIDV